MQAGLVDGVAYQDQLDDLEPSLRRDDEAVDWVEAEDYDAGSGGGVRLRRRPRIAVLYAVGTIVSGRSGFDATDGDLVGSDSIVEDIRRIRDDRSIRGIVLRIDSPGGSSVASDVILRELMLTKERDARAPDRGVDVRSRRVGRLLHRARGRRDRGAAGHAHRLDRDLHREDRLRRHARTRSA